MKKILILSCICLCTVANAKNLVEINDPKIKFPAKAYKTVKPTEVGYIISFTNYHEPSQNDEYEIKPDKNGLYTDESMQLGKNRPEDFPETYPSINNIELVKMLKINTSDVVSKFKSIGKKQKYYCEMSGLMTAQFRVDYEGGDFFRFPSSQVYGEIYSATPVGLSKTKCERIRY